MHRNLVVILLLIAAMALAPAGCRRRHKSQKPAEDDGQMASVVSVREPRAALQLVRGFHNVEADAWRWTGSKFAVVLRPPMGAARLGARLEVRLVVPEVIFNRLGPMTLSATVNGLALAPETFTQAGEHVYAREVAANALTGEAVTVEFVVDKSLPPTEQDSRELSLIVFSVGLIAK